MSEPGLDLPACVTLSLRREAGTLHVTLDRPRVRNALSREMVRELRTVSEAIAGDSAVRCVVLRGAGGRRQTRHAAGERGF